MPLPQHELELKALAAERIRQNRLPARPAKSVWAGPGSGERCALCDRTIDELETEYELEAPVPTANSVVRLHLRCHALWQLEVTRLSD
jgi:hypothetical protein